MHVSGESALFVVRFLEICACVEMMDRDGNNVSVCLPTTALPGLLLQTSSKVSKFGIFHAPHPPPWEGMI